MPDNSLPVPVLPSSGPTAHFPDRTARELLLLHAYESLNDDDSQDDHPLWTRADAQWATKVASQTTGAQGSAKDFLAARAHAAMQRLAPRDEGVRRALALRGWRWSLLPIAALVAFVIGAAAYDIGTHQRIDLLAMPVWVLVLWNLVVYLLLALAWVRGLGSGKPAFGALRNFIGRRFAARVAASPRKAPALFAFGRSWAQVSWPMTLARAGSVLHVAAAALALGLAAGMYLRGLVLDYRAGWQSTFLEPPRVTALLSTVLKPASILTGVPLPDEAAVAELRVAPDQSATRDAAPWIHLHAATLAIFVVVPRLLLALGSVLRGAWLSRKLPVPIDEPYHQRLWQQHRRQHGGAGARVRVFPHGAAPGAAAALSLRKIATRLLGDDAELDFATTVAYGSEDAPAPQPAAGAAAMDIVLFDASATPEAEAQGRFVESLRGRLGRGTALLMVVDEAAFAARFGGAGERLEQRRAAWRDLADKLGMPAPVFVNLETSSPGDDAKALETALTQVDAKALPAAS
jgi:hypothetical protein